MKLTGFHLDGSRVYLAPIGPGFNVVHCPTGNRTAPVSESLRAVLFGAMCETGWPTAEGGLLGSVDVTDETGSGRVTRRNAGHGPGPLELSLHDGRSHWLTGRIEEMARSAGSYQIIDFGNGRELTDLAIRVCAERLEIDPQWRPGEEHVQWHGDRRGLQQRERELVDERNRLSAEHEHQLRGAAGHHDPQRDDDLARCRRREAELREELAAIDRQVEPRHQEPEPHHDPSSRMRGLDAQMDRIEQVCDDLDARLGEINHQLQSQERGEQPAVERSLEELRGMAAALERQLTWLDADRHTPHQSSTEAERWELESSELRRTVADLVQTISRQERSLNVETLRTESKQIRRCRSSLRQRLRRLWALRERISRPTDRTAWAPSADTTESPRRRDQIHVELRRLESEIQRLWTSPQPARPSADLLSRIESIEAELAAVRRELHREPPSPSAAPSPPADHRLMHHAAMQLSQLSEGELVSLRYDAPTRTLFVTDYEGKPHASYDLPLDVQRLVALSLLLSFADARFPVVLDRVFEETPLTAMASVLEVLRDSCRDGMQILAIVYDNEVADRLQELRVDIRHADWAAPQERVVRDSVRPGEPRPQYAPPAPASDWAGSAYAYQVTPPTQAWRPDHPPSYDREACDREAYDREAYDREAYDREAYDRGTVRRTITPQAVRIFEDSYRPKREAEAHSHRHHLDYADSVTRIPYFGRDFAERLEQYGYWTVSDFLRGDAEEMVLQLRGDVSTSQLRRWQAQCQLICGIARLRAFDAKILVACGITDPLQLQRMDPTEMMSLVSAFVGTPEGRRLMRSGTQFEVSRVQRWISSATEQDDSDGRTGRYSRRVGAAPRTARGRRRTTRAKSSEHEHDFEPTERDRTLRTAYGDDDTGGEEAYRTEDYSDQDSDDRSSESTGASRSSGRGSRGSRSSSRSSGSGSGSGSSGRSGRSSSRGNRSGTSRSGGRTSRSGASIPSARLAGSAESASSSSASADSSSGNVMTFYLDMQSDVEAAPTIGPKTAELLYEIGIHNVGHLLESTPAEVAEQLNHARISANNVLEWQLQSALVCRVPELRGHDAQILVACGVTDAEQLATCEPEDLFAIVEPFVDSKAGKRIVRTSKAPDLAEVTDWIDFAKHARTLKAA